MKSNIFIDLWKLLTDDRNNYGFGFTKFGAMIFYPICLPFMCLGYTFRLLFIKKQL